MTTYGLKTLLDDEKKVPLLEKKTPLGCCCECLLHGCVIHQTWDCDPHEGSVITSSASYVGFHNIQSFWANHLNPLWDGMWYPSHDYCSAMERLEMELWCQLADFDPPNIRYFARQSINVDYFFPYWYDGDPPVQHSYTAEKCAEVWTAEALAALESYVLENHLWVPNCYSPDPWETQLCDDRDLFDRIRRVYYYYCDEDTLEWTPCQVTHVMTGEGVKAISELTNGRFYVLPEVFPWLSSHSPDFLEPMGKWFHTETKVLLGASRNDSIFFDEENLEYPCQGESLDHYWQIPILLTRKEISPGVYQYIDGLYAFIKDIPVSGTVIDNSDISWKLTRECTWMNQAPARVPPTVMPQETECTESTPCEDWDCDALMLHYPYENYWTGKVTFKDDDLCPDEGIKPLTPDDMPADCKVVWKETMAPCTNSFAETGAQICEDEDLEGYTVLIRKGPPVEDDEINCWWYYLMIADPDQTWYLLNLDCLSCIDESIEVYDGEELCGTLTIVSHCMTTVDQCPAMVGNNAGRHPWTTAGFPPVYKEDMMWIEYKYYPEHPIPGDPYPIVCTSQPVKDEFDNWVPSIPGTDIIMAPAPDMECSLGVVKHYCPYHISCKLLISYECVNEQCWDCWFRKALTAAVFHEVDRDATCILDPADDEEEGWHYDSSTKGHYVHYYECESASPPPSSCDILECDCEYLLHKTGDVYDYCSEAWLAENDPMPVWWSCDIGEPETKATFFYAGRTTRKYSGGHVYYDIEWEYSGELSYIGSGQFKGTVTRTKWQCQSDGDMGLDCDDFILGYPESQEVIVTRPCDKSVLRDTLTQECTTEDYCSGVPASGSDIVRIRTWWNVSGINVGAGDQVIRNGGPCVCDTYWYSGPFSGSYSECKGWSWSAQAGYGTSFCQPDPSGYIECNSGVSVFVIGG